jgi:transposase
MPRSWHLFSKFYDCPALHDYLAQHASRIVPHFHPKYAPEMNSIERVWCQLHETITRNHRCQSIDDLLREITDWTTAQNNFYLQTVGIRELNSLVA